MDVKAMQNKLEEPNPPADPTVLHPCCIQLPGELGET